MIYAATELPTETELTARAAQGDVSAYSALVALHYPACLRYAEHMLRDREDAEDTVQDTFLRAHLALDRYDERQQFKAWLFQILVNRCRTIALQRSRRRSRFPLDEVALRNASAPADEATAHHEAGSAIRCAVEELDPLHREAFLLKYVEEMDYAAMSLSLGASVSALKMRVKRACEALRPRLVEIYREQ